jgi:twitching motility protein PilI
MSKGQALRNLQTRLSERLQLAQTQGATTSWLAVEVADSRYLFPLELAGEIFPPATAQKVSYTCHWFMGVANLRGQLSGIVDLSAFLGGGSVAAKLLGEDAKQDARYVALHTGLGLNCALLVSKLIGLRSTKDYVSVTTPEATAASYLGAIYTDKTGQTWQELNLQALAADDVFLSIAT